MLFHGHGHGIVSRNNSIVPCPFHVCRCPSFGCNIAIRAETHFTFSIISGPSGHGNPDFLVPLESLSQARSAGTLQMSVGALVEPQ